MDEERERPLAALDLGEVYPPAAVLAHLPALERHAATKDRRLVGKGRVGDRAGGGARVFRPEAERLFEKENAAANQDRCSTAKLEGSLQLANPVPCPVEGRQRAVAPRSIGSRQRARPCVVPCGRYVERKRRLLLGCWSSFSAAHRPERTLRS